MNELAIRVTHRSGNVERIVEITTDAGEAPAITNLFALRVDAAEADEARPALGLADNGDGTVTDHATGLMWSKDDVLPDRCTQAAAAKACASLRLAGHDDWGLPTRAQLLTLVDDERHEPAIDVSAFPSCKSAWYWTRTPCAWSSDHAWLVDFYYGYAGDGRRGGRDGFVRAVRRVSAGQ